MNTDILERLREELELDRQCELDDPLLKDAAAEIERLRDEGQKDYDGMREFQRKFIDACHEIERLHEKLARCTKELTMWPLRKQELLAKNVTLKELLRESLSWVQPDVGWDYDNGGWLYDRIDSALKDDDQDAVSPPSPTIPPA